jgi:2-dehydropantoate 2-reductase
MNIVIVGQGAIGLLWATQLARDNSNTVAILSTKGDKHELFFATNCHGYSEQSTIKAATNSDLHKADLVIFCLKAFHIAAAIKRIIPRISPEAALALCHNGLGTLEEIKPLLPANQMTVALLISHGAYRPQKNHVIHTGLGTAEIGLVNGKISENRKLKLVECLNQSLPPVSWHEDIKVKQWIKLAINCVINPITAINGIKNGQVLNDEYTSLIDSLCKEIAEVASHEGVILCAISLANLISNVARNTAQNHSSMFCDLKAKQPTEIDYINGYVVKCANKYMIEVPSNKGLLEQVKNHGLLT